MLKLPIFIFLGGRGGKGVAKGKVLHLIMTKTQTKH